MKSGNLNFLEPSGPLQACNGTALPLPLPLQHTITITTESTLILLNYSAMYYTVKMTYTLRFMRINSYVGDTNVL